MKTMGHNSQGNEAQNLVNTTLAEVNKLMEATCVKNFYSRNKELCFKKNKKYNAQKCSYGFQMVNEMGCTHILLNEESLAFFNFR